MTRHIQLLVIDPQNDFCDLPEAYLSRDAAGDVVRPALPVAGAHADMQRLAGLIRDGGAGLTDIAITLDSHQRLDIAHPTFWRQRDGSAVTPFTPITAQQVRAGSFVPRDPSALPRTLAYLDELEARGRYTLMVWPIHCEIGSWGHNVHADLRVAYNAWEESALRVVQKVTKGENPWTEHYSAMQAEVPDMDDEHTQLNEALLAHLDRADMILIAGEASSHCVKATTEHIVAHLPGGRPERITLLTDCMSPVGGFESQHEAFFTDMRARGVQLATAAEVLPLLQANA
ncbi:cysteine hydrolase [Ideonella sp. YS5]|uniref:cysteine hydrolase n=1 Tax=Ideonella sp. YS5 TaxID=3453714 RepID=UPI003EED981C